MKTAQKKFPVSDVVINALEDLGFSLIAGGSRQQAKTFMGRYACDGHFVKVHRLEGRNDSVALEQLADEVSQAEIHGPQRDVHLVFDEATVVFKLAPNRPNHVGEALDIAASEGYTALTALVKKTSEGKAQGEGLADELASLLENDPKQFSKFLTERMGYPAAKHFASNLADEVLIYEGVGEGRGDVAYIDLSTAGMDFRKPAGARIAYNRMLEVVDEIHLRQSRPVLSFLRAGPSVLVVSYARGRDQKVQLFAPRLRETGWVRANLRFLTANGLPRNAHGEIDVDAALHAKELDAEFHEFCQDFRLELLEDMLNNPRHRGELATIISAIDPAQKNLTGTGLVKKLQRDPQLQNLYLAICDGLVLRTLIHRFIEVYHGVPFSKRFDDILETHTDEHAAQKGAYGLKRKGHAQRFRVSRKLRPQSAAAFKKDVLALDDAYTQRYGGDVHYGLVAKGTRALEEIIGPEYLCELLDLTNAQRYSFKYEDLRPDALELYYQRSLETSLQFVSKGGSTQVLVDRSGLARKDLGAYFTPSEVSRFIVEATLGKKLDEIENQIEQTLDRKEQRKLFEHYVNLKIVDPTVGGGSFLKEAFRAYTAPKRKAFIQRWLMACGAAERKDLKGKYAWVESKTADFEEHVLTKCLYGVDLDIKALSVASQTLTLEALHYLDGEEKFPNFINFNLKCGNAFVSPVGEEWKMFAPLGVKKILSLRQRDSRSMPPAEMEKHISQEKMLIAGLLESSVAVLDNEALSAFCWQLEFPEAFFDDVGAPKKDAGFDVVVGNPPWEVMIQSEEEFMLKHGENPPKGKNARKEFVKAFSEFILESGLTDAYAAYKKKISATSAYVEDSGHYRMLEPVYTEVSGSNGHLNTYKMACERYLSLVGSKGQYAFIVPEGILGDKGTRDLRRNLVDVGLSRVITFKKVNDVFPDACQAFSILVGDCAVLKDDFVLHQGLVSKEQLQRLDAGVRYSRKLFLEMPVETKPILGIQDQAQINVLAKYFLHPALRLHRDGNLTAGVELNTTTDFDLVSKSGRASYFVCKGEHIDRFVSPNGNLMPLSSSRLFAEKKWAKNLDSYRVAWRNIAGLNDPRRMYAAVIPPKVACFHSLNVLKGFQGKEEALYYVGVMNSFCYEFFIRLQSKNNNVNIFLIKLSPLPPYEGTKLDKTIAKLAEKLGHGKRKTSDEAALETLVAQRYGFTREEFKTILQSFEGVDESVLNAEFKKAA